MTIRRADARFLLPFAPATVEVLRGVEGWKEGVRDAGLSIADGAGPDLIVAQPDDAGRATASGARALLLEGGGVRRLPGYGVRTFAAVPEPVRPALIVPLDRPNVLRYVLDTWTFPRDRVRALAKGVALRMPRLAARALGHRPLVLGVEAPGPPFLLAEAARRFDVDGEGDWFLVLGQADPLARCVFVVFPRGAGTPGWALKFARIAGYADPFDQEERGYALLGAADEVARHRAPRPLGRFAAEGFEASLETVAPGRRLDGMLTTPAPRRAKLRAIRAVADWLVELGVATRGAAGSAAAEVDRLRRETLPRWAVSPGEAALERVGALPGVLQHNDLGAWNVVVDRDGRFTVLDWEKARACGLPLWDLWYFLADALLVLDGPNADTIDAFVRLFRGDAPSSPLLFERTRAAAAALGIPDEAVGPLASLCWLHHGLSKPLRAASLAVHLPGSTGIEAPAVTYADAWFADPALGNVWSRWRAG